jgi:hypothetical protein
MRRQDGNRPILTFCDILGHFHAIMQCTYQRNWVFMVKMVYPSWAVRPIYWTRPWRRRHGVGGKMLRIERF